MKALLSAAAAVAALTLAFSACGDDGDDGGDFAAELDQLCVERARASYEAAPLPPQNQREAVDQYEKLAQIQQGFLSDLSALEPPEEDRASFDQYLEKRRQVVEATRAGLAAARKDDRQGFGESAQRASDAAIEGEPLAGRLGAPACARQLPASDEKEIREVIDHAYVNPDRSVCGEETSDAVLEAVYDGSVKKCAAGLDAVVGDSVRFEELTGVEGAVAEGTIKVLGGNADGKRFAVDFVYEDGRWKLNNVGPAAPES